MHTEANELAKNGNLGKFARKFRSASGTSIKRICAPVAVIKNGSRLALHFGPNNSCLIFYSCYVIPYKFLCIPQHFQHCITVCHNKHNKCIIFVQKFILKTMEKFVSFCFATSLISGITGSTFPTCNVPDSELGYSKSSPQAFDIPSGRLAVYEKGELWPNSTVYFTIDEARLNNKQIMLIYQAIQEYHSKTCIRFKPWKPSSGVKNYITITSTENGACSLSEVCMKGGQQYIQLGGPCWFKGMVVHQLGHALCLGHEHQRPIRDQYLSFHPKCTDSEIPAKLDDNADQLGFYDYASQMHFGCGWCGGGWPKDGNFTKCGHEVTEGLSLLDADYINLLYGCGGCKRHRWVPMDKISPMNSIYMPGFGLKDKQGDSLYPCRVSFGGEVVIGKFTWRHGICSFSLGGKEHYQTGAGTEILTIPGGLKSDDGRSEYRMEDVSAYPEEMLVKIGVPAGRLPESEGYGQGFVAFGRVMSPIRREYEDSIGKAWERDGSVLHAFFPLAGQEVVSYYFKILTCHE